MNDGFSMDMVLRSPDILAAAIALLTGILGLAASQVNSYRKRVEEGILGLGAKIAKTEEHAQAAADGVNNTHSVNLRADLDAKFQTVFRRLDVMEEQRQKEEEAREYRDRRVEAQVDGLRDDIRLLTASVKAVRESAESDSAGLDVRLRKIEERS